MTSVYHTKPLCIDLYAGLGGWAEGFLGEGYDVIGFDIERWPYPGQLVIQDVQTLHGSQFKDATIIVASPPCQAYSYRAMPWKRAKALGPADNTLFEACFRIQREASEAAGHHIPLIVENVRGAQKWVGRAKWHYGSYYLWGDVPALMPMTIQFKSSGMNWSDRSKHGQDFTRVTGQQAIKNAGGSWFAVAHNTKSGKGQNPDGRKGIPHRPTGHWTNPDENGVKNAGNWWSNGAGSLSAITSSHSKARKQASALIAKIPFPLAQHIARVFKPDMKAKGLSVSYD